MIIFQEHNRVPFNSVRGARFRINEFRFYWPLMTGKWVILTSPSNQNVFNLSRNKGKITHQHFTFFFWKAQKVLEVSRFWICQFYVYHEQFMYIIFITNLWQILIFILLYFYLCFIKWWYKTFVSSQIWFLLPGDRLDLTVFHNACCKEES